MKYFTCILFWWMLFCATLFAQAPVIDWDRRYGGSVGCGTIPSNNEALYNIIYHNNSFILSGLVRSNFSNDVTDSCRGTWGGSDYWCVKTDTNGNNIWNKRFGGSHDDHGHTLIEHEGNYYFGGFSPSSIEYDRTAPLFGGYGDYWIIKMDINGNKIWDKAYGGIEQDNLLEIIPLSNHQLILYGNSASNISPSKSENSRGSFDIWLVKIDSAGNKIWDKTYGGNAYDGTTFHSVTKSFDRGVLIGATSGSTISSEKSEVSRGMYDYWIIKIDSNGVKEWDRTYGGTDYDNIASVLQLSDGCFLLGGSSISNTSGDKTTANLGDRDYWVVKIDSIGNKIWDKTYGGTGYDVLNKMVLDRDNNILLGGLSKSGLEGNKSEPSKGGTDMWLIKIDPNGNILWDKSFGGSGNEGINDILILSNGDYILAGNSSSPADGDKSQPSWGGVDFWILKTKPGNPFALQSLSLQAKSHTDHIRLNWTDTHTATYAVLRLKSQNPTIWDTLTFTSKSTFSDTSPKTGHNFYQICRMDRDASCYLSNIVEASFQPTSFKFLIYPNPASQNLTIDYSNKGEKDGRIEFFDLLGKPIYQQTISEKGKYTINTERWNEGIYLYHLTDDDGKVITGKILITR